MRWIVAFLFATSLLAGGVAEAKKQGTIAGTVAFEGSPPERKPVEMTYDPFCAKQNGLDEKVVVVDGGLTSAFVLLEGKQLEPAKPPKEPVVIDQVACMYTPRVVGAIAGQTIQVRNSDGTMHNVHGYKGDATIFNLGQPKSAPPIEKRFDESGEVIGLRCDVHPWMRAYIAVVSHRYFAVSGKGGAFTIENVPPGSYTLKVWHPELGEKTAKVRVRPGKTAKAKVTYTAK